MNAFGSGAPPSPFEDVIPTSRAITDGYLQEAKDGFMEEQPQYNPLNVHRPQSSPLVDLKDPIQLHLLTETALSDSREWAVLSQEEVDALKRQCQSLQQRIEQTRANLAIQSKYRDAAISLAKLYSPTQTAKQRLSMLSNRSSMEAVREANAERQACEKRCESLASELFQLEKRLMEPQRRLLQHTAAILQLTHHVSPTQNKGAAHGAVGFPSNGIPGSPESMYSYSGEQFMGGPGNPYRDDMMLDDRSLYFPIDQPFGQPRLPDKSPNRKETKESREESDRVRQTNQRLQLECDQLRASNDSLGLEMAALERENEERQQSMSDAGQQIERLNNHLRLIIVQFNPEKIDTYEVPPSGADESNLFDKLAVQIQYLKDGLSVAQQEQEAVFGDLGRRLTAVNSQIRQTVAASGASEAGLSLPPNVPDAVTGADLSGQLSWLENVLPLVESEVGRAAGAADASRQEQQGAQEANSILANLWEMMQSGFAERERQRQERSASRAQMGLPAAEEDEDPSINDAPLRLSEPFSLGAFSAVVEWLYAQTSKLRDQKAVLQRQIKQQRELNSKSDKEKDAELQSKMDELQNTTEDLRTKTVELQQTQRAAEAAQDQLASALAELNEAQETLSKRDGEAERELSARGTQLAAIEAKSSELQTALAKAEADVVSLTARLEEAAATQKEAEASAEQAAKDMQGKDEELEKLNNLVVQLKTEAVIAKAELDGAYGSRAQRAADVAALAKSSENDVLQVQLDNMKAELTSTLREYEDLTKDSLAAEREKLNLEGQLDDALTAKATLEAEIRATRDKLEAEVAKLKEELDAERLKVAPSGGSSRAGATMLSEQFRATMKEERKKFQEEMRNEQMQRRRLEDEIRALRRAAGPGKSPLSPR